MMVRCVLCRWKGWFIETADDSEDIAQLAQRALFNHLNEKHPRTDHEKSTKMEYLIGADAIQCPACEWYQGLDPKVTFGKVELLISMHRSEMIEREKA